MKYVASRGGEIIVDGVRRWIDPGVEFEYDGKPGRWMVPVDESRGNPKPVVEEEPRTMSEIQQAGKKIADRQAGGKTV